MTFRLAAQERMLDGDTLEEKFAFALSVGFDGIELSGRGDGVFAARADELRRARANGVVMPSAVVAQVPFLGDFDAERRQQGISELGELLRTLPHAGAAGIVSPNSFGVFSKRLPPFAAPRDDDESRRLLVAALREVAAVGEEHGTAVFLEPLNRFEDYLVNTLEQASRVVDDVASPAVRVIADTFHMSIEEADIGAAIRAAGQRIAHVQLGDSNRLEPGAGHYDWDETLTALEEIGYDGWLAMECGLSGEPADVLPRVSRLLKR
ncbi:sugar phosphate isomerase/epimerase family protein [Plantactinospora endophytica]|uniref:Xylose isomerase n=1 Tax=Plantactinospora endophytica TaxID=673535 RepID=A0ABQ4E1H7_9ACTN|nr:sugar phosphate isomerase/epimerase family protein [Plantactinospora endophytica]GIG88582.1 xylose isomerase [Plantactinospora endophytica]